MSALGGFAKGLSDGLASGQRYRLNDAQAEREAKMAGWAEEEHNRKVKLQGEEDAALEDQKATYNSYYGPKTVEQPDAQGNLQKVTVEGKKFGQDPFHDMNYLSEVGAKSMLRRGANPKDLMAAAEYVQKFKETEGGKQLMGALAGDAAAKAAVMKTYGIDGETAKWDINPEKGVYKVTDAKGHTIDLHGIAGYLGAANAWKMMNEQTKTAQETESHEIDTKTGKYNLEKVLPAKVSNLNAATGESNAKANLYSAEAGNVKAGVGKGGTGAKVDSKYLVHAEKVAPRSMDDPKSPDVGAVQAITNIAATRFSGEANHEIAVNKAAIAYTDASALVDRKMRDQGIKNDPILRSKLINRQIELSLK